MTKKLKFEWEFKLSEDYNELEVWLNDSYSKGMDINHPSFYEHLSNALFEISLFQFMHGTKTNVSVSSFGIIKTACSFHDFEKGLVKND